MTKLADVAAAMNGTLTDDVWNMFSGACADPFYFVVYDLFSDGGWLEATINIVDTSTGNVVVEDIQMPQGEELYFFDLTLCRQSTAYSLSVTPDCDSKGSGGVAWELWSGTTWTIVSSGSDCVKNCNPLSTNPCPSNCAAYGGYCEQVARRRQLESQQRSSVGSRRNLAGDDASSADDGSLADDSPGAIDDSPGAIDDNNDDSVSSADDAHGATDDVAVDDAFSQDDVAVATDPPTGYDNSGTDDGSVATDDVSTDDISSADDQPIAGVPSTPTSGISSFAPTHVAQPFPEPTANTPPISAVSAAPSMFPTSLKNVFGVDLRDVSSESQYFFITLDECEPASIADSACDSNNNNAACGWDGGDCCLDTCVSKGQDCSLSESDCTSPVKLGSSDEDGDACSFDYESRRRLDEEANNTLDDSLYYGDDTFEDDEDGRDRRPSSPRDCLPDWPFGVAFRQAQQDQPDWHLKMPFTAYEAFRDVMTVRNGGETIPHEDMPSIFCGDCGDLMHLKEPYQSFKFKVSMDAETNTTSSTYSVFPNIDNLARSRYFVRPNLVHSNSVSTERLYPDLGHRCLLGP